MGWMIIGFFHLFENVKSPTLKINKKGENMPVNLIVALMPLISKLLDVYIKSTASKKDDEVLEIVKKGAEYLAQKDNNDLTCDTSDYLKDRQMTKGVYK